MLSRVAVLGDFTAGTPLRDVSNLIHSWNPAVVVSVGDDYYSDPSLDSTVGQYFGDYLSSGKFFSALGNHDYDNGLSRYINYFNFPGNERYYSTVQGNVEIFVVNSNSQEPDGTSANSTQGQWIKNALARSTATWKLVFFHHPAYTSGTEGDHSNMQWPFQQWGADAVFSGHDHMYERILKNGFPYFVDGLGGANIVPPNSVESGSQVRYSNDYGAMLLDAGASSLNLKFINRSGSVKDDYTITKSGGGTSPPPPPPPPPSSNTTFIATGSSWRYLDNGSNQGTAWRGTSFDDSVWRSGNAQLGYGDGDEATVVSYGGNASNKYVTTYFRRSFSVSDPSSVSALGLSVLRDDGAVVYLNGTEVYRTNMPSGTVAYNTFASTAIEDNTYYSTSVSASLLRAGSNVIAVEIHQASPDSSDISFNFALTGNSSGGTTTTTAPSSPSNLGATAISSSQVALQWTDNSSNESGFRIERSTDGSNFAEIATASAGATTFTDSGRSASTRYYYRVRAYNSAGNSDYTNTASATTMSGGTGGGTVYLSDLAWVSATNGWGPVERDHSVGGSGAGDGRTITLNGVTYSKGLGAHAISDIVFNLAGGYSTFQSDVGIDDETGSGSVVFQVFADGVKIYDSGTMGQTTATKSINVSVAGVQQLQLHVGDAGNGIDYDHADWANARLTSATSASAPMTASAVPSADTVAWSGQTWMSALAPSTTTNKDLLDLLA